MKLDRTEIIDRGRRFALLISERQVGLYAVLRQYETNEVAVDETERTLDLLLSLSENAAYFERQVRTVAAFLPRNQPLYALACFGIVPAFMAREMHVHVPTALRGLFGDMAGVLDLEKSFPNMRLSQATRSEFVAERLSTTDAVIFTGNGQNADQVRKQFPPTTLFIANGSGHNPIVVSESADIDAAVKSAMRVQLYNQGQDCAAPNAILVHRWVYEEFLDQLREAIRQVKVGSYADDDVRVGPIGDRDTVKRAHEAFHQHHDFLDPSTPGTIRHGQRIVEPTIIAKPLETSGNYKEHFAPIFFVQVYERDADLASYFDDVRYAPHAMYVTVFGESAFVDRLLNRPLVCGRVLHDDGTIVRNTDLHAPGVERGTQPYGGYGRWASSLSINGVTTPKPTCPQRDIFEHLVLPGLLQ